MYNIMYQYVYRCSRAVFEVLFISFCRHYQISQPSTQHAVYLSSVVTRWWRKVNVFSGNCERKASNDICNTVQYTTYYYTTLIVSKSTSASSYTILHL
jgi:hypothetical protein